MNKSNNNSDRMLAQCAPRIPYHPIMMDRFGIDAAAWKSLVEAVFPGAQSMNSVVLALSYCKARKLDPFKRNVHIVPIWNSQMKTMVDTIWPGIGELRTTAFRTGEYAGRGATEFGPDIEKEWELADKTKIVVTFPEWAQVTVSRMVQGQRVEFAGPKVYWLETYAVISRKESAPNSMWQTRPRGQLEKCAEAAALRAAFPEEVGQEMIGDEVQHGNVLEAHAKRIEDAKTGTEGLLDRLNAPGEPEVVIPDQDAEAEPEVVVAGKAEDDTEVKPKEGLFSDGKPSEGHYAEGH